MRAPSVLAAAPRAQAGWDRRCSDELTWGHWLADAIADVNAELPMWAGAPGPRLGAHVLTASDVAVRYGERTLFHGLKFDIPTNMCPHNALSLTIPDECFLCPWHQT